MSSVQIRSAGGNPTPASQLVNTDNKTVFGDGSSLYPITTGPGSLVPFPDPSSGPSPPSPGSPILITGPTSYAYAVAGINQMPNAQPLGLVSPLAIGGNAIQTGGVLELPIADWNAIIDGGPSTGLSPATFYYASSIPGNITPGVVDPLSLGNTKSSPVGARIGYAISTTKMLIMVGSPAATIVLPNNGATVGMAVLIDEPASTLEFTPAIATAFGAALASALAAVVDGDGGVIGFTSGMVLELPTLTWDGIAGTTGGLNPDVLYYVSAATPGHITATPPVAMGSYVQVIGRALTSKAMFIQIGTPIGPHA